MGFWLVQSCARKLEDNGQWIIKKPPHPKKPKPPKKSVILKREMETLKEEKKCKNLKDLREEECVFWREISA